ncbi:MAG: DNA polymerase III subunit gamma/tau [Oscillospiraceae bacterium]|nr:DNA polymerase III subunit gamma/tau [Oscillospiraceae bacterium]
MYQALYRKWRPKTFDDVIGQDHITKTLKNQIKTDKLSHAYLFTGTRGTGKTTCAKILAKAVNCENLSDGNPCCECKSCTGIDSGAVTDVVELDAASNNGVDNVRALREEAVFSPAQVKKRVYIVDEVHMLSTSAFNALLKILEEPPSHLMFILATTEMSKVPVTVLSRCQRHGFKRIDSGVIADRLMYIADREAVDLKPEASVLLARLAEGSMRDALSLLDRCPMSETVDTEAVYSAVGLAGSEKTENLFYAVSNGSTEAALTVFSQLWREGKDPSSLLSELCVLARDALILKTAPKSGPELVSGSYDIKKLISAGANASRGALISLIEVIQTALFDMKASRSPKITAEMCLISLCEREAPACSSEHSASIKVSEAAAAEGELLRALSAEPEEAPGRLCEKHTEPEPVLTGPDTKYESENEKDDLSSPEKSEEEPIEESRELAADTSDAWQAIVKELDGKLPFGIYNLLSDSSQITGTLDGEALSIAAAPGFALNMLNMPDILSQLEKAASVTVGKSVRIRFIESTPAEFTGTKSLDELSRFEIVTFK